MFYSDHRRFKKRYVKMANDRHCGCSSSRLDHDAENECTLKIVSEYSDKMTSALDERFKRTQVTFGKRMSQMGIVCVLCVLLPIAYGQMVTRDPRFYSREGDLNYQWPNPGDPEYR